MLYSYYFDCRCMCRQFRFVYTFFVFSIINDTLKRLLPPYVVYICYTLTSQHTSVPGSYLCCTTQKTSFTQLITMCMCVYCTQNYACLCMLSPINIRRQSRLTTVTTTTRRLRGIYECFALSIFCPTVHCYLQSSLASRCCMSLRRFGRFSFISRVHVKSLTRCLWPMNLFGREQVCIELVKIMRRYLPLQLQPQRFSAATHSYRACASDTDTYLSLCTMFIPTYGNLAHFNVHCHFFLLYNI